MSEGEGRGLSFFSFSKEELIEDGSGVEIEGPRGRGNKCGRNTDCLLVEFMAVNVIIKS